VDGALEGLSAGTISVKIGDGVAAARALIALGDEPAGISRDVMISTFICYMTAAARVMDPTQMTQFGDMLRKDPRLRELEEQCRER
jgi:hypothetical protein